MKPFISNLLLIVLLFTGIALQAQTFTNYTSANGLPSDNVTGVAVDASNHKWFGTQDGVAMFNDTTWTTYTIANGLIDNYIFCIAVDIHNHIWVGTDYGISTFDGTTWTSYTVANGLVNNTVNYIAGDRNGSVWIGTGDGLSNFDGTTWKNYTTANGLTSNLISYIATDTDGNTWLGTYIGGLLKFDGTTFTNFTIADSLPDNNIISIGIGAHKTKWIGTYKGVAIFDSLDKWVATYRKASGLVNDFVQDIAMDSKNTMWFGIYDVYTQEGGISRNNSTVWQSYTVSSGLVNNLVKRIAVDKSDYVWITTGSGVSRLYDPSSGFGELAGISMSVYPNPATTEIHIDGVLSAGNLRIMTIEGKTVVSQLLTKGSNTVSVQGLASGLYILKYTTGEVGFSGKLVIR